jgi:hypothetical protein
MPGDPRECRRHAARCAELAVVAALSKRKRCFWNCPKAGRILQSNYRAPSPNLLKMKIFGRTSNSPSTRLAGFGKNSPIDYFEGSNPSKLRMSIFGPD